MNESMENSLLNVESSPSHVTTVVPHDDAEWESRKDKIYGMYILGAKTTKVVKGEMEKIGFLASIQQYERRFRKWGWRKHESKSTYDAVHRILKRKQLDSTETEVSINDCVLHRTKLVKAMNRRQQNLYEKLSEQLKSQAIPLEGSDNQQMASCAEMLVKIKPSLKSTLSIAHIDSLPSLDFSQMVWSTVMQDIMPQLSPGHAASAIQATSSGTLQNFVVSDESILPLDQSGVPQPCFITFAAPRLAGLPSWIFQLFALITNDHVNFATLGEDSQRLDEILMVFFSRSEVIPLIRWLVASRLPSAITMIQRLVTLSIFKDDIQLFDNLVKCGMDALMRLPYRGERLTLLQLAISLRAGHGLIRQILDAGVSVTSCGRQDCEDIRKDNECCCCEWTPIFMLATEQLDGAKYSTVLNNADDICVSCFNPQYAIEELSSDAIKSILQKFPALLKRLYCPNFETHGPYFSDLQIALGMQNFDLARFLLQNGASVDCVTPSDFQLEDSNDLMLYCFSSPLALAVAGNQLDIARDCLDAGADLDVCYYDVLIFDDQERWATSYDFPRPELSIVATKNLRTYVNDTLTRISRMDEDMGRYIERWYLLTENASGCYYSGLCYPLQAAVYKCNVDAVNLMLERGADLLPRFGIDPLRLALVYHHHHHIATILMERARENCQGHLILSSTIEGVSLAAHASVEGDTSMVQFLLGSGADMCDRAGSALTPLEAPIAYGSSLQCIHTLLQHSMVRHLRDGSQEDLEASLIAWLTIAARRNRPRLMLLLVYIHRNLAAGFGLNAVTKAFDLLPDSHDFLMSYDDTRSVRRTSVLCDRAEYWLYNVDLGIQEVAGTDQYTEILSQIFRAGDHYRYGWIAELFGDALLQGACKFSDPAPAQYLLRMLCDFDATTWRSLFESSIKALSHPGWNDIFESIIRPQYVSFETQLDHAPVYRLINVADCEQSILARCLRSLLEAGFSPNRQCSTIASPLMIASKSTAMLYMVGLLLEFGANPSFCATSDTFYNEGLFTALAVACKYGNIAAVRKLITAGADVNGVANSRYETCLAISSREGHQDVVLHLLASGSSINLPASNISFARSALQAACEQGHSDIAKILINRGAKINAPAGEDSGITALQGAAIKGHIQICQILVGCGAKVSAPASPRQGRTAIDAAAEHGRLDVLHFLLDRYDGDGPLVKVYRGARSFARGAGHDGIVRLLDDRIIALGEDPSIHSTTSSDSDCEDGSSDQSEEEDLNEY